jgi:hypothetical protein
MRYPGQYPDDTGIMILNGGVEQNQRLEHHEVGCLEEARIQKCVLRSHLEPEKH